MVGNVCSESSKSYVYVGTSRTGLDKNDCDIYIQSSVAQ